MNSVELHGSLELERERKFANAGLQSRYSTQSTIGDTCSTQIKPCKAFSIATRSFAAAHRPHLLHFNFDINTKTYQEAAMPFVARQHHEVPHLVAILARRQPAGTAREATHLEPHREISRRKTDSPRGREPRSCRFLSLSLSLAQLEFVANLLDPRSLLL